MSIYSTREMTRQEAIDELSRAMKMPWQMTNEELEDSLFQWVGREGLPNSPLNNYRVRD